MEEKSNPKKKQAELLERLKSSFPPAAVAGAFASFASAALGGQPKPSADRVDSDLVQISLAGSKTAPKPARGSFEFEYSQSSSLQGKFHRSLSGIAIGPADRIFVLADGDVKIFGPEGSAVRNWKAPEHASCIAVGRDDRVYLGVAGRVEIFDDTGNHKPGFEAGESGRPARITAIKATAKEILVADAAARYIRRYDFGGKQVGEIGTQNKTRGFMLPNGSLDFDIDPKGTVLATDTGRHRVSSWTFEGAPVRHFGKFGLVNPEDFVGCCNPVNLASSPDGKVVTAEKVIPRVKVYDPTGKLLALIGPENFDSKCIHLHLAVNSKGRILVADPVRLEIKMFSAVVKSGGHVSV